MSTRFIFLVNILFLPSATDKYRLGLIQVFETTSTKGRLLVNSYMLVQISPLFW